VIPAGLVLAAMAGLWIAYLVPHWLRHRQHLLESCTDDRFSEQLRVIRVARAHGTGRTAEPRVEAKAVLHPARGGGRPMDRPHATADRVSADAARRRAAEHAHRAAVRAERVARARRRAVLSAALVVLSAAGWTAVGLFDVAIVAGAVPSVLLLVVLALGRRAARAGQRQSTGAAPAASTHLARRDKRRTTGRAVRPSDAVTEVLARVAAERPGAAEVPDAAERPDAAGADLPDGGWVPVPVPVPAYTLKPAVRRAEPPPLVLDEQEVAAEPVTAPKTGSLDLDAVLARRRASGE
jgi:hypothetical protein